MEGIYGFRADREPDWAMVLTIGAPLPCRKPSIRVYRRIRWSALMTCGTTRGVHRKHPRHGPGRHRARKRSTNAPLRCSRHHEVSARAPAGSSLALAWVRSRESSKSCQVFHVSVDRGRLQKSSTKGKRGASDLMATSDPPGPTAQHATGPWSILDCESSSLLGLLDPKEAFRAIAADVPRATGLEVAWIGVPQEGSCMVLHYFQRTRVFEAEGLIVPMGRGLGGQVLVSGKPCFVPNYVASENITHHFEVESQPVVYDPLS